MTDRARTMWLDVTAGAAGDMILAALLDAGASLEVVAARIDAVLPGAIRLSADPVRRAGLRATKVAVTALEPSPPRRTWPEIQHLLAVAAIPDAVRRGALSVFARLAVAEGRVHGIDPSEVHFHEVGALDSIADVIGACAAIEDLGITELTASPLALGSGSARTQHGLLPVPVPAVLELVRGWIVQAGPAGVESAAGPSPTGQLTGAVQPIRSMQPEAVVDEGGAGTPPAVPTPPGWEATSPGREPSPPTEERVPPGREPSPPGREPSPPAGQGNPPIGELATPTGAALVTALATACGPLPAMRVTATGVGAGTKDFASHANVVRVVIGAPEPASAGAPATSAEPAAAPTAAATSADPASADPGQAGAWPEVVIEANVDDLDPRTWPAVLAALLDAGARDAWLTPILMKKGRPAHTLHVLTASADADFLRAIIIAQTSTIGLRSYPVTKYALARTWLPVEVSGQAIQIKVAHDGRLIRQATPEFADVQAAAATLGLPVRQVLRLADAAAVERGLSPGQPVPT